MSNENPELKNVLIADNDYFFATFLEEYFNAKGYVVNLVSNGREAIEKLKEKEYHIVIIDLHMPKINGIEVINYINQKIKKKTHSENLSTPLPITILVSSSLIEQYDDIKQLGADFSIPKAPSSDMKEILDGVLAQIKEKNVGANLLFTKSIPVFPRESSLDLLNEINYYHNIFESLPFGVLIFDRDSAVLKVNRSAEGLLRRSREDLLGQEIGKLFSDKVVLNLKNALYGVLLGSKAFEQVICDLEHGNFLAFVGKLEDKGEVFGWILAIEPLPFPFLNETE